MESSETSPNVDPGSSFGSGAPSSDESKRQKGTPPFYSMGVYESGGPIKLMLPGEGVSMMEHGLINSSVELVGSVPFSLGIITTFVRNTRTHKPLLVECDH